MAWDINHVVVIGRLTKDPELTYTQSGSAVCKFSIAVNRSSGSQESDGSASFFNIVAWNKTAEICKEYLAKGRQVGIDGRLQQRRWEAQDGSKRSSVEIVANNVQFFGSGRGSGGGDFASPGSQRYGAQGSEGSQDFSRPGSENARTVAESGKDVPAGSEPFLSELDDDEIPF